MPIPVHTDMYYVIADFSSDGTLDAAHWTNTFFFKDDTGTPLSPSAAATAIQTLLNQFYNGTNAPGSGALLLSMSANIDNTTGVYKVYDLNNPAPRVPIIKTATMTAVGSNAMPNEVAACISYRGDAGTGGGGTLDKSARGRLYIGPLAQSAADANAAGTDQKLTSTFYNRLAGAAKYLITQTTNDLTWVQYSRTLDRVLNVEGGFVDKAFDTQRRRGAGSDGRVLFP